MKALSKGQLKTASANLKEGKALTPQEFEAYAHHTHDLLQSMPDKITSASQVFDLWSQVCDLKDHVQALRGYILWNSEQFNVNGL